MGYSRGKKLALNTFTSLLLELTNVISGFILPRLILGSFGSDINGLVNSITQFLGVIALLDLGVGAVVKSALYKPLAENDNDSVSKIFVSASKFFKRLAIMLLIYVIILIGVYPFLVNKNFGYLFTAALIGAICISSFAQYYFGIVNSLLLTADQKGYIQYTTQIVTIIVNTVACAVLIKLGGSIQIVKLTTSLVFLCRPLFLNWYVKKHYDINRKITYTEEPIKQKWNGMAQHFAAYVLNGTDNIVLTLFSTLSNVSIYSIYNLVVYGVFMVITALSNGFSSYFGNLFAKKEKNKLESNFKLFEWSMHTISVLVYGCTGVLIIDFIRVYTKGIKDADYAQPLFATLIIIAFTARAIRIPYNYLILAAGHYKQTQSNYIIAMIMNIVLSIVTVKIWGLVGVAIGTLAAMVYQTIWMAWYDYENLVFLSKSRFIKQIFIDIISSIVGYFCTFKIVMTKVSYISWLLEATIVFIIWVVVVTIINVFFYINNVKNLLYFLKRRMYK